MTDFHASKSHRLIQASFLGLVVSASYLYAFPQPKIIYVVAVLVHTLVGVFAVALLAAYLPRMLRSANFYGRGGWSLIAAASILGLLLIKVGTSRAEWRWLYAHIALALVGVSVLLGNRIRTLADTQTSISPC